MSSEQEALKSTIDGIAEYLSKLNENLSSMNENLSSMNENISSMSENISSTMVTSNSRKRTIYSGGSNMITPQYPKKKTRVAAPGDFADNSDDDDHDGSLEQGGESIYSSTKQPVTVHTFPTGQSSPELDQLMYDSLSERLTINTKNIWTYIVTKYKQKHAKDAPLNANQLNDRAKNLGLVGNKKSKTKILQIIRDPELSGRKFIVQINYKNSDGGGSLQLEVSESLLEQMASSDRPE